MVARRDIRSSDLRGTFLGGPFSITVASGDPSAPELDSVVVEGSGRAAGAELPAFIGLPAGIRMSGSLDWTLALGVAAAAAGRTLADPARSLERSARARDRGSAAVRKDRRTTAANRPHARLLPGWRNRGGHPLRRGARAARVPRPRRQDGLRARRAALRRSSTVAARDSRAADPRRLAGLRSGTVARARWRLARTTNAFGLAGSGQRAPGASAALRLRAARRRRGSRGIRPALAGGPDRAAGCGPCYRSIRSQERCAGRARYAAPAPRIRRGCVGDADARRARRSAPHAGADGVRGGIRLAGAAVRPGARRDRARTAGAPHAEVHHAFAGSRHRRHRTLVRRGRRLAQRDSTSRPPAPISRGLGRARLSRCDRGTARLDHRTPHLAGRADRGCGAAHGRPRARRARGRTAPQRRARGSRAGAGPHERRRAPATARARFPRRHRRGSRLRFRARRLRGARRRRVIRRTCCSPARR